MFLIVLACWTALGLSSRGSPPPDWAWSHDGRYLYVDSGEAGIFRIHIPGGKEEKLADAKDIHRAVGGFGTCFGLTPEDSPPLLRNLSSQQI